MSIKKARDKSGFRFFSESLAVTRSVCNVLLENLPRPQIGIAVPFTVILVSSSCDDPFLSVSELYSKTLYLKIFVLQEIFPKVRFCAFGKGASRRVFFCAALSFRAVFIIFFHSSVTQRGRCPRRFWLSHCALVCSSGVSRHVPFLLGASIRPEKP